MAAAKYPWPGQILISPAQLAEAAHVSPRTVLRLISDGKLEGFKVGQSHRIPREEAFRFLRTPDPEGLVVGAAPVPAIPFPPLTPPPRPPLSPREEAFLRSTDNGKHTLKAYRNRWGELSLDDHINLERARRQALEPQPLPQPPLDRQKAMMFLRRAQRAERAQRHHAEKLAAKAAKAPRIEE
jgi:excisionase family DNA binding protein